EQRRREREEAARRQQEEQERQRTLTQVQRPKERPAEFEQDMKDALEEWRTKGSSRAYFEGQGPNRIGAWQAAAERGEAVAQWLVARCLQEGTGATQSPEAAVSWLRRAAEGGLAAAQNDLGDWYYAAEGATGGDEEAELARAVGLFTRAAEQGFPEAQKNLGVCYGSGNGVRKNPTEAVRWARLAAERGWSEAMIDLACSYESGDGVEKDAVEAARWYRMAAELGHPEAQEKLDDLEKESRQIHSESTRDY